MSNLIRLNSPLFKSTCFFLGCIGLAWWSERQLVFDGFQISPEDGLVPKTIVDRFGMSRDWLIYLLSTLGLFLIYFRNLRGARNGAFDGPGATRLLILLPGVLCLALAFTRPFFSIDLFSYAAFAKQATLSSTSLYSLSLHEMPRVDWEISLQRLGWQPNPTIPAYGPLWMSLAVWILKMVHDVLRSLIWFKALAIGAHFGTAALVWKIMAQRAPQLQRVAFVAYFWNPSLLFEIAGDGHNDSVMTVFVLLSVFMAMTNRPGKSIFSLTLAVLVKYWPFLFLPGTLTYFSRQMPNNSAQKRRAFTGLAAGMAIAVFLYQPFWSGIRTFHGVISTLHSGLAPSLLGLVSHFLSVFGAEISRSGPLFIRLFLVLLCIAIGLRVRREDQLIVALTQISLIVILLFSHWYWPWYITLPVALLALRPASPHFKLIGILSLGARLIAPLDILQATGLIPFSFDLWVTIVVGGLIPIAAWVMLNRTNDLYPPA